MRWFVSHRFDPRAAAIADRHYSRQTVGSPQFVRPGHCVVLLTSFGNALWVTSWQPIIKHAWKACWENTLFRNESDFLSSELIREAVSATRWKWGDPPSDGLITFVDRIKTRHKRDPGRCYRRAGFEVVNESEKYVVLRLGIESMPPPEAPHGAELSLFGNVDDRIRNNAMDEKWKVPKVTP